MSNWQRPINSMVLRCPCCEARVTDTALSLGDVPLHSCLSLRDATAARAFPRGKLALLACGDCGYLFNPQFDPDTQRFSADYESSQAYSPHFRAFSTQLAGDLVARYGLQGGSVLEIGCGSGEFLQLLREAGVDECIGIDPAYRRASDVRGPGLLFYPEPYSTQHHHIDADLLICRHTLEHIATPLAFLRDVRAHLQGTDTPVFFEVPEARRIIQHGVFWDIYYEHCAYYTPASLAGLFRRAGFRVVDMALDYADQYLLLWAVPGDASADPPHRLEHHTAEEDLLSAVRQQQQHWQARLRDGSAAGEQLVLWGSGSKAVAFVSAMGELVKGISAVVDINPRRQGLFLPGSGLPIIAPEALRELSPDRVLVMNPIYRQEIDEQLAALGVVAELTCLPV